MKILGFQKTTLLDYPGHIASTVFTAGCNLRCPYCQNSELILPELMEKQTPVSEDEIFDHLKSHIGRIEGVAITGGEPTLQRDLSDFCKKIKDMGLMVKLDTNGTDPETLSSLINEGLIDYAAVDIKLPTMAYDILLPKDISDETKKRIIFSIRKSIDILRSSSLPFDYELRTTVVDELFDNDMISAMAQELSGIRRLFLQAYRDSENVLLRGLHTPSTEALIAYRDILKKTIPEVEIRGVDL